MDIGIITLLNWSTENIWEWDRKIKRMDGKLLEKLVHIMTLRLERPSNVFNSKSKVATNNFHTNIITFI